MANSLSLSALLTIAFSFLIALLLSIVPLPDWLALCWPHWLALVVIYWVIAIPERVSLGIAWLMGLLLDALYGSVLGEHALALSVVAYVAGRLHQQIRMFPFPQQALSVLVIMLIYQTILIWIQGMLGTLNNVALLWIAPFVSMLMWPWLNALLASCQRRFRIN